MPAGLSDMGLPATDRPAEAPADSVSALSPVDAGTFTAGMALLAGAVNVVTTQGASGPSGFTATAVCSVSAEPPVLLVCLNESSSAAPAFGAADTLCVNTLSAAQAGVAQAFGGKVPMAERFAAGRWRAGASGAPVLEGTLVSFEARIVQAQKMGTHRVLFCEVVAVHRGDATEGASVYWQRGFCRLDAAAETG